MVRGIEASPKGTEALYREQDGKLLIEIELQSLMQIFNSFDPAPFHEKELDVNAEVYIYNSVAEFPLKKPLELIIYLPPSEIGKETEKILNKAIKNHFSYKSLLTDIELRRVLQRGRRNMAIGVVFLFLCLLIIGLLSTLNGDLLKTTLSEGLTIIGWVAMWEPVNVFLYGWWPLIQKKDFYNKIMGMDVKVSSGPIEKIGPLN
jgi:hypothetical protein